MTMAIDWTGIAADPQENEEERRESLRADPALARLIDRQDDRLLRDAGLARDDVLGPEESFRREWASAKALWAL